MKVFKIVCLVFILPLLAFTTLHKYYVSVTQIDFIQEKKSVQITSRIFIDDLEDVLQLRYSDDLIIKKENEAPEVNLYIEKYLKGKLRISINGEEKEINYLGKKIDNDIVVCYLEIEGVKEISTFEVENAVLFDLYAEQQNIVRTKMNSKNKSFILIKENDKGLLNFK
ncbi:DUF6702 family protein [Xanthomarina sp. GH4-25]|uniref:DUF6702 family protein n=1 Tax=Xanthomarina sp. GH4-25 TaxID=3349335 RepID=UPI000D682AE2|nr:peptidase E [Flavobacteriaceae bacterium LYZ1037]